MIEIAICLPVLVLMVFGTLEITGSIFLKQTLTSAAHEGALVGMQSGSTEQSVRDRVNLILASRELTGCNVDIAPLGSAFEAMAAGDEFTVTISKGDPNSYISISSVAVQVTSQRP